MSVSSVAERWVEEVAGLTRPGRVVWCDGSKAGVRPAGRGHARGTARCCRSTPRTYPELLPAPQPPIGRRAHRAAHVHLHPRARRTPAPPTTGWRRPRPRSGRAAVPRGACAGRTMYVIPYLMGPAGSPMSRVGVMVTDSAYVVASMHIMTRMGAGGALEHMRSDDDFIARPALARRPLARPPLHPALPRGEADLERRLGLRRQRAARQEVPRAAHRARRRRAQEGWLAEHMLILGVEDPEGRITYLAAAMPSACGKTNLAMVGLAACRAGACGRWATTSPGSTWTRRAAPRHQSRSAASSAWRPAPAPRPIRTRSAMVRSNTIFTNVALTPDGEPWWEGIDAAAAARASLDWQGRPWTPGSGPAAHPNSRFTVPAHQCPSIAPELGGSRRACRSPASSSARAARR